MIRSRSWGMAGPIWRGAPGARLSSASKTTALVGPSTGKLPFDGPTKAVVFDALLNRAPGAPRQIGPAIPHDLERIILKALEKDRETRYQSASDMRADLKRLARQSDPDHAIMSAPLVAAGQIMRFR